MRGGPVVQLSTRTSHVHVHVRHGFKHRMDHTPRSNPVLTIQLRSDELSLEGLYRPACPRRMLRQIENDYMMPQAMISSEL